MRRKNARPEGVLLAIMTSTLPTAGPSRVTCVVGARPNFVKTAPLLHALARRGIGVSLLHTGQHYDRALSDSFIEQLDMPRPDVCLGVGSGSHAEQTAAVLVGVEKELINSRPDALVVVGDVNSTVGAALAAAKLGVPIVHLESGLRSGDWTMPEEINRVVTDKLSDLLLCHCREAVDNLAAEGIPSERVALVGNTMIDSLMRLLPHAQRRGALNRYELTDAGYVLVTLHRPAVVDDPERLSAVLAVLRGFAKSLPVVFPLHPRTRAKLEAAGPHMLDGIQATEPLEYFDFIALEASARMVVTDSGGVQEETSALGVPCLTYRDNTERFVTCDLGTNQLVGVDPDALARAGEGELAHPRRRTATIPLWDGHAGERAGAAISDLLDATRAPASLAA
jgi:UDP-N-acetylglucosamine 2-epimerase (non-hydrolysing)